MSQSSPVAIVTGAAQGLGAVICVKLLKKGFKVCVADIKEEQGKQFVKEQREQYGAENVEFIVCDVTKEKDYKGIFDFTLKKFKKIDLVVNNAGIMLEQNPRKVIDVNVNGPIIGCQLAFQYMGKSHGGKGGMVINTASIAGFIPFAVAPVYTASKHAVVGLTRSYGTTYHMERDDIVFAAICPFYIDTDMVNKDLPTNTLQPGFGPTSEKEKMSPEYVAQGFLKLLEDRINGSTLMITPQGYQYVGLQEGLSRIEL